MPWIVVDPGVLVSSLLAPQGAPAALLRLWHSQRCEIIVSPALLEELDEVLARPKLRAYVTLAEAAAYVALLRVGATLVPDPPRAAEALTPDPDDDYLVALARGVDADYLVSGDAHLLHLRDPQPPVLTPRACLDRLESQEDEDR